MKRCREEQEKQIVLWGKNIEVGMRWHRNLESIMDQLCISLNKIEVNGCIGCNACRYGKPCVQKDSFNQLVPK